jgi:replicative DNA helicase
LADFDISAQYGQQMPYNLEAEQSVLGAVLIDPACFPVVMENLRTDMFHRPQHQQIFDAFLGMFTRNEVMDFITILEEVKRQEVFETAEDAKIYLTNLAQVVRLRQMWRLIAALSGKNITSAG